MLCIAAVNALVFTSYASESEIKWNTLTSSQRIAVAPVNTDDDYIRFQQSERPAHNKKITYTIPQLREIKNKLYPTN
jgi:hypothetical protein